MLPDRTKIVGEPLQGAESVYIKKSRSEDKLKAQDNLVNVGYWAPRPDQSQTLEILLYSKSFGEE